jgi:hypothetical protein
VSGAFPTVEPRGASAVQELSRRAKAVVFDLDDTLLLTREVKWAHHRAVAKLSYGIDPNDFMHS